MNIGEFLAFGTNKLSDSKVESARLDCLILIEKVINKDRSFILAHPDYMLNVKQLAELNKYISRRENHEPIAYITNRVEFYGRNFIVDKNVLIPRPESEDIISLVLGIKLNINRPISIADIGTGSGCLGITAALEIKNSKVDLYDISLPALKIAKSNSQKLNAKINAFRLENLLSQAKERKYDFIICNLPYVPKSIAINADASFEPEIAIFAKDNGLEYYGKLLRQISSMKIEVGYLVTESLALQHKELSAVASSNGFTLNQERGLAQLFKSNRP